MILVSKGQRGLQRGGGFEQNSKESNVWQAKGVEELSKEREQHAGMLGDDTVKKAI